MFQAKAYASDSGILDEAMIDEIVQEALRAHTKKEKWQHEQEKGDYLTPFKSAKNTFVPPDFKPAS